MERNRKFASLHLLCWDKGSQKSEFLHPHPLLLSETSLTWKAYLWWFIQRVSLGAFFTVGVGICPACVTVFYTASLTCCGCILKGNDMSIYSKGIFRAINFSTSDRGEIYYVPGQEGYRCIEGSLTFFTIFVDIQGEAGFANSTLFLIYLLTNSTMRIVEFNAWHWN